tara:strand:- start:3034 stop:3195 length:162 start_codon:yes stop_codon:yes gene_type:complete
MGVERLMPFNTGFSTPRSEMMAHGTFSLPKTAIKSVYLKDGMQAPLQGISGEL